MNWYIGDVSLSTTLIQQCWTKHDYPHTTTKIFKHNLLQYLSSQGEKKKIIEMGSSIGITSMILAPMASKLVCVDINPENLNAAKKIMNIIVSKLDNPERFSHVEYMEFDLYGKEFKNYCETKENNFDIAFIDAKHDLEHVLIDLENVEKLGVNAIILDDWGTMPEVVKYIHKEYVTPGYWSVKYIGSAPLSEFPNCVHKTLKDWEGVILEKNENSY